MLSLSTLAAKSCVEYFQHRILSSYSAADFTFYFDFQKETMGI